MEYQSKPIVIGIVGHLSPFFIADFKQYIEKYPNFRLIIFKESNNKLWIIERDGKI